MTGPSSAPGPIVVIEDANDERLIEYRHLRDPAAGRRLEKDGSCIVVEGRVAVGQLLRSALSVRSLLVDDHQRTLAADLVEGVRSRGAPVFVAPRHLLADTVGFDLHRGVVALADRPTPMEPKDVMVEALRQSGSPVIAVLEGLNDHENLGALFRNAAAFGVTAVMLSPSCADPLYRRSIRVSVGRVLHVPFARATRWPQLLSDLRDGGLLLVALVPRQPSEDMARGGADSLAHLVRRLTSDPQPVAVILGAEGPGLSAGAIELADLLVTIPMADGVDSLNVATAAAIAFHRIAELD